jgi:hypothetical protein
MIQPNAHRPLDASRVATATTPLIIDDVESALTQLSALGRDILAPSSLEIRAGVLAFANAHGWAVESHSRFATWCLDRSEDGHEWLVLDALLDTGRFARPGRRVRLSRVFSHRGWELEYADGGLAPPLSAHRVGIIDDAAVSGDTIAAICQELARTETSASRILLCTTSRQAFKHLSRVSPMSTVDVFVSGDHMALHLRDACPFLPFSGRRIRNTPAFQVQGGRIEPRAAPIALPHPFWGQVYREPQIQRLLAAAYRNAVSQLGHRLKRRPCLADLSLFGPNVTMPVRRDQRPALNTLL